MAKKIIKWLLIRNMSTDMMVPESLITKVVDHQFESVAEAMLRNSSVEVSGFGRFLFNKKKAVKDLVVLEEMREALEKKVLKPLDEKALKNAKLKLHRIITDVDYLRKKVL